MPVGFGRDRRTAIRAFSACVSGSLLLLSGAGPLFAQEMVPSGPLGREFARFVPDPGNATAGVPARNPTEALTLRDALALALMQNPSLAAYAWETRAREARVLQAGRRPNPSVSGLIEDIGSGASASANQPIQPQATIQLNQLVELGGKRSSRRNVARAERDLAAWDYEAARMGVLTSVTQAFTDVLAAQESVRLTDETTALVEKVLESVKARVTAGDVSPIEETRASVVLASVRLDAMRARRALEASRTRLAALWGSPVAAFGFATGDLRAEPPALPPREALAARLAGNPDLARWSAEIVQREAVLAAERARSVPDVTVTGGYRRFTEIGDNAVVVGASIGLPLFDRNRDAIEEARSRVARAREDQRAAEMRVSAALADAYAAMASAYDEVAVLRSTVLPGSQEAFDAVTEGYRLGRFTFQDVVDAQRTRIAAGSQYLRALADYRKAIANVERLIGAPLSEPAPGPDSARE